MADNTTRVCVSCQEPYSGPTRRGKCNACRNRAAYHQDGEVSRKRANARAHYLKYKYGLSIEDYDAILDKQDGVCAICGGDQPGRGKQRFHVDHDHACCPGSQSCGECVRGLLCNWCNVGLSQFRDDATALLKAAAYLGGESRS